MKRALILLIFALGFTSLFAQSLEDKMSTIPKGTVLTLKEDFLIPPFEGILEIDHGSDNYLDFSLVFSSKEKRRMMRKGTEFYVDMIELEPNAIKILVKNKIHYVYFGRIKSRDNLTIKELTKVFDVTFPEIEDF
jgi:hypothetical protein